MQCIYLFVANITVALFEYMISLTFCLLKKNIALQSSPLRTSQYVANFTLLFDHPSFINQAVKYFVILLYIFNVVPIIVLIKR